MAEILTNGDMLKALFPNIDIDDLPHFPLISLSIPFGRDNGATMEIRKDWWDAPYEGTFKIIK